MGRYARLALAEREEIMLLRRGGKLRRDGRSDGRGQSDRQQGDGRRLVRRWLGAVLSCIGRPAWLRVPKGFLRAARGPRRRARGGACAASCRAGALVVREHWSPGRIAGGIAVERPGLMVFASAIHRAINERRLGPPGLTRTRRGIRARPRHKGKRRHGRGGPEERRGEIPGARPIG